MYTGRNPTSTHLCFLHGNKKIYFTRRQRGYRALTVIVVGYNVCRVLLPRDDDLALLPVEISHWLSSLRRQLVDLCSVAELLLLLCLEFAMHNPPNEHRFVLSVWHDPNVKCAEQNTVLNLRPSHCHPRSEVTYMLALSCCQLQRAIALRQPSIGTAWQSAQDTGHTWLTDLSTVQSVDIDWSMCKML